MKLIDGEWLAREFAKEQFEDKVDEETIKLIIEQWIMPFAVEAVPLSVIEDIKVEINELSELDHIEPTYEDCKRDVLEILDKYKASPTGEEVE